VIPPEARLNPMVFRDLDPRHSFACNASKDCTSMLARTHTSPNLSSSRNGRLRAELTVSNQWSYPKYGKENAGGHEPPRGDPGGRDRWNAS
jgi:hypothetical protein